MQTVCYGQIIRFFFLLYRFTRRVKKPKTKKKKKEKVMTVKVSNKKQRYVYATEKKGCLLIICFIYMIKMNNPLKYTCHWFEKSGNRCACKSDRNEKYVREEEEDKKNAGVGRKEMMVVMMMIMIIIKLLKVFGISTMIWNIHCQTRLSLRQWLNCELSLHL